MQPILSTSACFVIASLMFASHAAIAQSSPPPSAVPFDIGDPDRLSRADYHLGKGTLASRRTRAYRNPGLDSDGDGWSDLLELHTKNGLSKVDNNKRHPQTNKSPFAPRYLGTSPEVRFDLPLRKLAHELNYNPLTIYRWVYENITHQSYSHWAARKGALATYLSKNGNEWDHCALLIALFRISGIPARFAHVDGNTQYPIVQAWLGTDLAIRPYSYRPGVRANGTWYPFVPWFKQGQQVQAGLPVFGEEQEQTVPAQIAKLVIDYLYEPGGKTSIERFEEELQIYLDSHHPGYDIDDVPRRWNHSRAITGIPTALPADLPPGEIHYYPDDLLDRRRLKIKIRAWDQNDNVVADWSVPAAALASRVTYVQSKRSVINGAPAVIPTLQLEDGTTMSGDPVRGQQTLHIQTANESPIGSDPKFGTKHRLEMPPGRLAAFAIDVLTGAAQTTHRISDRTINQRSMTGSEMLGHLGATIAATYLERLHKDWLRAAALTHITLSDHAPVSGYTPAMTSSLWVYTQLPDPCDGPPDTSVACLDLLQNEAVPHGYLPKWTVHISHNSGPAFRRTNVEPFYAGLQDSHLLGRNAVLPTFLLDLVWHDLSFQESESIETWTFAPAFSTISARHAARALGISEIRLDKNNIDKIPNSYSSKIRTKIKNYIRVDGNTPNTYEWLLIPERPFAVPGLPNKIYYIYGEHGRGSALYLVNTHKGGEGSNSIDGNIGGDQIYGPQLASHYVTDSRNGPWALDITPQEIASYGNFIGLGDSITNPGNPSPGNGDALGTGQAITLRGIPGMPPDTALNGVETLEITASNAIYDTDINPVTNSGKVAIDGITAVAEIYIEYRDNREAEIVVSTGLGLLRPGEGTVEFRVSDLNTPGGDDSEILATEVPETFALTITVENGVPVAIDLVPSHAPSKETGQGDNISITFEIPQSAPTNPDAPSDTPEPPASSPTIPTPSTNLPPQPDTTQISDNGKLPFHPQPSNNSPPETDGDGFPLGNPPSPPNQVAAKTVWAGDPVNLITGEFYTEELPDLRIKSHGMDLAVRRGYRSRLNRDSIFGYGWTWNHGESIAYQQDGDRAVLLYRDPRGITHQLPRDTDGKYDYPLGVTYRVVEENNAHGYIKFFHFVFANGMTKTFSAQGGMLLEKRDKNDNYIKLEYTRDWKRDRNPEQRDRLTKLIDRAGQYLEFSYDPTGRYVAQVSDHDGRTVTYTYEDRNLVTFCSLDQQPDCEDDKRTTYQYLGGQANPKLNHNMIAYTLPSGDSLAISYYDNDTVRHHKNNQGRRFRFRYDPVNNQAEIENERKEPHEKIVWDDNNNIIQRTFADGTGETREYDDYHNMTVFIDRNHNRSEFRYDTKNPDHRRRRNLAYQKNAIGDVSNFYYTNPNHNVITRYVAPTRHVTTFQYYQNGNLKQIKRYLSLGPPCHTYPARDLSAPKRAK